MEVRITAAARRSLTFSWLMKIRFSILTILVLTTVVAIWFARLDPHGEMEIGESMSSDGNRYFVVTYCVRPGKWDHVEDKLELAIIQCEEGKWPPALEFEFHWTGKFKLKGISPPQWPLVAMKMGQDRIALPSDNQLHEIWDGKHSSLDADLPKDLFQRFVDTSESFPRLTELQNFLDEQRILDEQR